ncbi:hypothetical protein E9232_003966 [Inquilinus ginsengisoli]|uniref:Uncharacterized protein n=1 Tax=Inquilinus ginsengisoli TaxID=363840 RepID=A0ABU1JT32_9PROT|nr:hypothetical protein [Inquilinus ginsengisoli]MDR6291432.1 hypothetical protein [Inquilinus ginsengisoli]
MKRFIWLVAGLVAGCMSNQKPTETAVIVQNIDKIESDLKNISDAQLAIFRRDYGTTIAIPAEPEALREIADQSCQISASASGISQLLGRIKESRNKLATKDRDLFWGFVFFSKNKIIHEMYFGAPYLNVDYTSMIVDGQKYEIPVRVVSWLDEVIDMGNCKIN